MANRRLVDTVFKFHKVGGHEIVYMQHDWDDSADPAYVGYLAPNGAYMIAEISDSAGTRRYYLGNGDYATKWVNKTTLSYEKITEWF